MITRRVCSRVVAAMLLGACLLSAGGAEPAASKITFEGVISEHRLSIKELGLPADWTDYSHLVLEMRTSSPQRFGLWIYTTDGPRRIEIQPFGQNTWLRASIPLQYLKGMVAGGDLAASTNRRTNSFWMSVWGPFGELKNIESIGLEMEYPINKPTVEIRNVHLAKTDEGSEFLDTPNVRDTFGQWALSDWPRKIKSQEQLTKELADEAAHFASPADFGYGKFNGYTATQAKATGFFRVENIDGKWWFVDPEGHLFLSQGLNGTPGGGRGGDPVLTNKRLDSWGMTTGGTGRPVAVMLRWQLKRETTFLGLPDVYAADFAPGIDAAANTQCAGRKDDPMVIGYFIGNEPPWGDREPELVDMILNGPDSATKTKLKEFLAAGDTPKRRKEFILTAFHVYLDTICTAIKKYDSHHLNLGIRFGGTPADDIMKAGKAFDVCSINVYEYEPTKQITRAARLTGRPIMVTEFHIGVPENGLGAGLVQAANQAERAIAYRYFVEQAASLDSFVGSHWFTWADEPVLGRMDGENYNIGFVDSTNRAYPELVEAAKTTNKRLFDVHSGKIAPFNQKPRASEAGAPSSPWEK